MNDGVLKPVEGSVAYWHERDRIAAARESQMHVLRAEIERLRAALAICASPWSSSATSVMGAAAEVGREFQRRMNIAGHALNGVDEQSLSEEEEP